MTDDLARIRAKIRDAKRVVILACSEGAAILSALDAAEARAEEYKARMDHNAAMFDAANSRAEAAEREGDEARARLAVAVNMHAAKGMVSDNVAKANEIINYVVSGGPAARPAVIAALAAAEASGREVERARILSQENSNDIQP